MSYNSNGKSLSDIINDIQEWSRFTIADGQWLNDNDILPIKEALRKIASGTVNWPSGGSVGDVLTLTDASQRTVEWKSGGGSSNKYTAGEWISKTALENNEITVSGYHNVYAIDPLYFEEAPADGNYPAGSVLLKTTDTGDDIIEKSWALYNYYESGDAPTNAQVGDDIDIIPPTASDFLNTYFQISFSRAMTVQVNISAKFKVKKNNNVKDTWTTVGFEGTAVTNTIEYSMLGYADQTFSVSTLTSVPESMLGTPIEFKPFANDLDVIDSVSQITISIHEI